jgi:hypothetical protein
MTFDFQKINESKRAFGRGLAALPIEEKLRLLDDLRERQLTIRGTSVAAHPPLHADKPRFDNGELVPQTDTP